MRITLTITSGARNGLSKHFDQAYIGLGRHPQSDLQFHPDHDLDASTRHAAILKAGETWTVRDLGSANGTFVNSEKVTADRRLHTGDQIRFGTKGPVVAVEVAGEAPPAAATRLSGATAAALPHKSTTQRIRLEVAKQTQHLRRATVVLFGLLIVVAGGYFWQKSQYEAKLARQRSEMIAQVDSLIGALDTVKVRFTAMQGALDSAQQVTQRLRSQIEAGGDPKSMAQLRGQLNDAITHQQGLRAAAGLDGARVDSLAGDAVALVIVKFSGDRKFSGTAFAVRSDASGAYLITNRHVVTSEQGEDPVEIGVMFNHSNQFFRANLVRKHPNAEVDMALLRVSIRGGAPVVPGISPRGAVVGNPVAAIGFPLGIDLEGFDDLQVTGAVATLTAGTVSRLTPDVVQIDGYGATGASGSPILDSRGMVVGVLYGGQVGTGGRIVYAEPAKYIAELLGQ
ncbi:MAG: trypsin-like peptidase domain-containing protein [Gemmatimonadales bacterium]